MAEFNYNKARETAGRLIAKFGKASSVIKKGVTGGTDSRGNHIADTPDLVISGIITPLLSYKTSEIDGTSIQSGDSYVFFHSDDEPLINMQVTINDKTFRVVNMINLNSVDDINVYRKLQLRV